MHVPCAKLLYLMPCSIPILKFILLHFAFKVIKFVNEKKATKASKISHDPSHIPKLRLDLIMIPLLWVRFGKLYIVYIDKPEAICYYMPVSVVCKRCIFISVCLWKKSQSSPIIIFIIMMIMIMNLYEWRHVVWIYILHCLYSSKFHFVHSQIRIHRQILDS